MTSTTTAQILEEVKEGKCTIEEAQQRLAKMKLVDLKKTTYKVSPKGAISFYGIRRMPITIYYEELQEIMAQVQTVEFKQFVTQNKDKLSTKKKNDDSSF